MLLKRIPCISHGLTEILTSECQMSNASDWDDDDKKMWDKEDQDNSRKLSNEESVNGANEISVDGEIERSEAEVNFINILWAAYMPISFPPKILTQTVSTAKHFCTKKLLVKCWWNWHLGSISSMCLRAALIYAHRSQKRKKLHGLTFFVLLGSAHVKPSHKMLMKLRPDLKEDDFSQSNICKLNDSENVVTDFNELLCFWMEGRFSGRERCCVKTFELVNWS